MVDAADAPGVRGDALTTPGPRIPVITPDQIQIVGAGAIPRILHSDPRGFLLETLRSDDSAVQGDRFAMSYVSLTVPGQYRDKDRWHLHRVQTDRFVVTVGEMILALYDGRAESPTYRRQEVIRMIGAPFDQLTSPPKGDTTSYLVPIPPGVCHCIGNLSRHPFLLTNFPTELYNPADEGRILFSEVPSSASGLPFAWDRVGASDSTAP